MTSDVTLRYRSKALIDDLFPGECTIHRATGSQAARWWLLWFHVPRDTDGGLEWFAVPVNPGAGSVEDGPGGLTWGLVRVGAFWEVSPSIKISATRDAVIGDSHVSPLIWHHTPRIVGVLGDEAWAQGEAP